MSPGVVRHVVPLALVAGILATAALGCSTPAASPAPSGVASQPAASAPATAPSAPATAASPGMTAAVPSPTTASGAAPTASGATAGASAAPSAVAPSAAGASKPFLPIGGPLIGLLTPVTGVGPAPKFDWTAIPGAARYLLFVFDSNGRTYWAWDGRTTSVYLGGLDRPPTPGRMGPHLDGPMTWAVVAYDAGGTPIASSPTRPIAP